MSFMQPLLFIGLAQISKNRFILSLFPSPVYLQKVFQLIKLSCCTVHEIGKGGRGVYKGHSLTNNIRQGLIIWCDYSPCNAYPVLLVELGNLLIRPLCAGVHQLLSRGCGNIMPNFLNEAQSVLRSKINEFYGQLISMDMIFV